MNRGERHWVTTLRAASRLSGLFSIPRLDSPVFLDSILIEKLGPIMFHFTYHALRARTKVKVFCF